MSEALDDEAERLRLRRGTRLLSSRSREREDSELELDSESELLDPDSEPELESESESDELERLDLRTFFLDLLSGAAAVVFSLSFSLPSKIRFAVPLCFLNSSGTSTEGLPSAFNLASSLGFSSISVREGRVTYGRGALHS